MRTRRYATHLVLATALALTACGGDDGDPDPAAAGGESAGASGGDVAVGSTDLGDVLVDAEGMTLYLFTPDEQGPSTCYDDCETAWPPLLADGDPGAGEGVDAALLGATEREDGTTQVTYDDWPLYLWQADQEPGDTTGQMVNDVWFVVSPDGEAIRETPGATDDTIQY